MDRAVFSGWGWFFAVGIIFIILGTMAILFPIAVAVAVEILLGWLLIINGLLLVIHSFGSQNFGGFFMRLLMGVLTVVFGGLILSNILAATITVSLLLAAFLIVEGVFKIVTAMQIRNTGNWGWFFGSGVVALVLGVVLFKWPLSVAWGIGVLLGIDMIFGGWAMIMLSHAIRKAEK